MGGGGTWHCFDDNAVDPWDVACLEKDCYGGRFTADVWDAKTNQHVPHVRRTLVNQASTPSSNPAPPSTHPRPQQPNTSCVVRPAEGPQSGSAMLFMATPRFRIHIDMSRDVHALRHDWAMRHC